MLRLSEELLLIAVTNTKGNIPPFSRYFFRYGLAGAVLQELISQKSLVIEDDKIKPQITSPGDDPIHEQVMGMIKKVKKDKKIDHWVSKVGGKTGQFKSQLLEGLVQEGSLKKEKTKKLFVFPSFKYIVWKDRHLRSLRKELDKTVNSSKFSDPEKLKLLALIYGSRLTKSVFKHQGDYKVVKQKVKELSEDDPFKKAINKTIRNHIITIVSSFISSIGIFFKS
jgi:hypothetical protein